jgi:hypothetical protein
MAELKFPKDPRAMEIIVKRFLRLEGAEIQRTGKFGCFLMCGTQVQVPSFPSETQKPLKTQRLASSPKSGSEV